ncbi:MAG: IS4 family transposase [Thermodesulfobacteriota bacterium]|nr:IS4 family transposase [Thermodesulfobacteriota bacterium]
METQNQIKRKLSQPEAIKFICKLLDASDNLKITKLADKLCEHFGFYNPLGEKQLTGCLVTLRELEQTGVIAIPQSPYKKKKRRPRRLSEPLPEPQAIPGEAGELLGLELLLVETEEQMRIWNEMMINDHPRGAGMLVGRQVRYLVQSEHGWLGGFSFSAAALHLHDRDKWIGWDLEERRAHLHQVVNMSRFLIRSSVSCRNLASRLLGMAIKKLPLDFDARYGYRPLLLESFVDTNHFTGTCYQAANWLLIGKTKGRGRQDRLNEKAETIKDIYVYPLANDFRRKIGLAEGSGLGAIDIRSCVDGEDWAEHEFGGAPLGDVRLSRRLVEIGTGKAEKPGVSYAGVVGGDWPKTKAFYRLIEAPDDSAIDMPNILLPHREQTIRRMKGQSVVLCIQDGSDLNYNNLSQCDGLGIIGNNQTGAKSRGLHLHSMIATTVDGLPLGVVRAECSAPKEKDKKDSRRTIEIPIEEKKTFCWIEGLRDSMQLKALMPHTKLINVLDREADFFELFDEQRCNCSKVDLLIRARYNRCTTGEYKLFETVRQSPVQARVNVKVPRQSARPKKSKQKARPLRPARTAEVSVRYVQVELNPPPYMQDKAPISVWVVHVHEDNPPAGADALEWFLLTTLALKSVDDALNCIKWYCLRWRIEDWHRVLKSGCRVEDMAYKTANRLRRGIAINLVIAWRIMLMTLLGREAPALPAEVLFSDLEIKVLKAYAKKKTSVLPIV